MVINKYIVNSRWGEKEASFITVITPVYNRQKTIKRTMESVDLQTFRDIEYIIIDDGSTDDSDDIIKEFMNSTDLPVMYIKKKNGGVHTARNIGYREARGKLILCIDSDDELLPEACNILCKAWHSIPEDTREDYWQIKAQCKDIDGDFTGTLFPKNINDLPREEAKKFFSLSKGEQVGCRVASIMKANLFPEPEDVTFVTENIRWVPLEKEYRSWGINDVIRIYHTEGDDHLSKGDRKKNRQDLRNMYWNITYQLNDAETFDFGFKEYIKNISRYCVLSRVLRKYNDKKFILRYRLNGFGNNVWRLLLCAPSAVVAKIYYRKKCVL